jgi:hypothetical protein
MLLKTSDIPHRNAALIILNVCPASILDSIDAELALIRLLMLVERYGLVESHPSFDGRKGKGIEPRQAAGGETEN